MQFSLEQKHIALQLYDERKSVTRVITQLGYPTRQTMYRWLWKRTAPPKPPKKRRKVIHTAEHPLHPSLEAKLEIFHRCFESGENVKLVSEETGYSRPSIYLRRQQGRFFFGNKIICCENQAL